MDESLEYPFLCHDVPALQKIASCRFCQTIWHECFLSENIRLNAMEYIVKERIKRRCDDLVEGLKLAKPIEKILKATMKKIHEQMCYWEFFWATLTSSFNTFGPEPFEIDIDWCVWRPNGEIDYRQSAVRALNSGRLADGYKFLIRSKFCMEEEIKTISVESLPRQIERVEFDNHPLVFYWVCYLKNQLERIPLPRNYTLEKTMASKCYHRLEMYGLEYFWQYLTDDYRIKLAKRLHNTRDTCTSWSDQQRIFSLISTYSTESIAIFAARYLRLSIWQSNSLQHQLRVWNRFKDQITDCDFAGIIDFVFRKAIGSEDAMLTLLNIWDTAYDHHRQYVAQNKVNSIIDKFKHDGVWRIPYCLVAFNILRRILLLLPEDVRSRLLNQHAESFVRQFEQLESLQKMVHLCLPTSAERLKFKYSLSQSIGLQQMCVSLLKAGRQADLNARLEWVFSDSGPNAVREYKKIILTLMTWKYGSYVITFFDSIPKWNELSRYIDETYAEDVQSALEIKRMLIEETFSITRDGLSFRKNFETTRQIVEMGLSVQDLMRFKITRLQVLRERLQSNDYWCNEQDGDEIFLENFVEWCCNYDQESVDEFKKRVPFGAMLNGVIRNVTYRLSEQIYLEDFLTRLDRYLKWLVGSDEKVKECKLQAIRYSTVDVRSITHTILKQGGERTQTVLSWFCGGDQATMERLRQRNF